MGVRLCIPVSGDRGLRSRVFGCFGSAPAFLVVDTDSGSFRVHPGALRPGAEAAAVLATLHEEVPFDGVVVRRVGSEALRLLHAADLLVYRTRHETAGAVVAAWRRGTLRLVPAPFARNAAAPLTDPPPACLEAPRAPTR